MKVIVKAARLSFCDLHNAKCIGDSKDPKFSATLICLNGDEEGNPDGFKTTLVYTNPKGERVEKSFETMQALCDHVAKEKFGKIPPKLVNWAYNCADGSTTRDEHVDKEGEYYGGFSDETMYISATKLERLAKDGKLTVLDQHKQPIAANSGLLFSGCFVNAVLDLYAYPAKNGSKDGVTASLEGIQLKKKGEPLGVAPIDAEDDFEEEDFEDEIGSDEADSLI